MFSRAISVMGISLFANVFFRTVVLQWAFRKQNPFILLWVFLSFAIYEEENEDRAVWRDRVKSLRRPLLGFSYLTRVMGHSNSQFRTPYEAKRTICLLDMSTTPSGIRVRFAGEELCSHKTLKASRVQKPIFSSQTCISQGWRKKNLCVLLLYENNYHKTLGSSHCLVTVLLRCDLLGWNFHQGPCFEKFTFQCMGPGKKKGWQ